MLLPNTASMEEVYFVFDPTFGDDVGLDFTVVATFATGTFLVAFLRELLLLLPPVVVLVLLILLFLLLCFILFFLLIIIKCKRVNNSENRLQRESFMLLFCHNHVAFSRYILCA